MYLSGEALPTVKLVALLLLWVGLAGFIFTSSMNPKGVLRRTGSAYVARLDADFRALMRRPRGEELAWLQVVLFIVGVAIHALLRHDRLLWIAVIAAVGPPIALRVMVQRRRAKIDAQANGFALALANALRTTASVGDAVRLTAEVTAKPLRDEIDTALREIHVGSNVEAALLAACGRAGSPALDVVVSATLVGHKTGGDLPRILEGTASSLRELKRLEEFTDKTTRSARQALFVMSALTIGIMIFLPRMMPSLFDPLFSTSRGQILLLECGAAFVAAFYMAWRITRKSI